MHAAYFDMDGTLLHGDSNNFLLRHLLREKVIDETFLEPINDFHHRYMQGQLQIEDFVYYIIKPFIGMPRDEREALIEGCLQAPDGLLAHIRPGGRAELSRHQASGGVCMIVSSTVDFVIEPLARALGVSLTAAAPLEYDEQGRLTGRLAGLVPYQQQKVLRIEKLLAANGLDNTGSTAYGDSINDLQMLCYAEKGCLINPSPALLNCPQARSMTILNWD